MRILITQKGYNIIKEIDTLNRLNRTVSVNFTSNSNSSRTTRNKFRKTLFASIDAQSNTKKTISIFYRNSKKSNSIMKSNTSEVSFKNIKKLNLLNKKSDLLFKQTFVKKYENSDSDSKNKILPVLNNIKSINHSRTNLMISLGEKYLTFDDILPTKTKNQMKKKILHIKRNKSIKNIEENFRSQYTDESEIEKFNKILSYPKININEINLIKYLNEKAKEPNQIKIVYKKDEFELYKMDKLCHMTFINEQKQKIFKDLINNKMKEKMNEIKRDFQKEIDLMKNNIDKGNIKLEKYNKKISKRDKYMFKFNDFVYNYWTKKNYERFDKKINTKTKIS